MEPRIQYAKTKDGVSIAFFTLGEGVPPLVMIPAGPLLSVEFKWQIPENRSFHESLAAKRMLAQYNGRGCGLSEGNVGDLTLDTVFLDLEAVVDRLQLARFALFGSAMMGSAAVTYAAQNPERVSHLILMNAAARGSDFLGSPRDKALGRLMDADWELYTETMARIASGRSADDAARQTAAEVRETATPETLRLFHRTIAGMDSTALLPQVRCPTLVLHRRQLSCPSVDAARSLASRIPDAHLALLEGDSLALYLGDTEAALTAIDEFLGEGEEAEEAGAPEAAAFRTVLFTDVEGSTALTQRLGDARARELLREHERIVREALKAHGGSEVKTIGDGFMTSFSSATRALESAIAMQRAFAAHNESAPEPIRVRVGLNAGEPIAEEKDLYGTAVNLAARICGRAEPGQILASDVVQQLAAGKGFAFADKGEATLKGFEKPVRLHEVRWQNEG
jgi:class 3 adenylate cyclase